MKKLFLSLALFSVLVIFTGCAVVFNLNSNNNLSVDVGTKVDIDTDSLPTLEPVVTKPVVTEPIVTEPIVTEPVVTKPVNKSLKEFLSKTSRFTLELLKLSLVLCCTISLLPKLIKEF